MEFLQSYTLPQDTAFENLRLMIFDEKPWNCIQAVLFLSRIVYKSDGYGWPIEHLKGNILQLSCGRV